MRSCEKLLLNSLVFEHVADSYWLLPVGCCKQLCSTVSTVRRIVIGTPVKVWKSYTKCAVVVNNWSTKGKLLQSHTLLICDRFPACKLIRFVAFQLVVYQDRNIFVSDTWFQQMFVHEPTWLLDQTTRYFACVMLESWLPLRDCFQCFTQSLQCNFRPNIPGFDKQDQPIYIYNLLRTSIQNVLLIHYCNIISTPDGQMGMIGSVTLNSQITRW